MVGTIGRLALSRLKTRGRHRTILLSPHSFGSPLSHSLLVPPSCSPFALSVTCTSWPSPSAAAFSPSLLLRVLRTPTTHRTLTPPQSSHSFPHHSHTHSRASPTPLPASISANCDPPGYSPHHVPPPPPRAQVPPPLHGTQITPSLPHDAPSTSGRPRYDPEEIAKEYRWRPVTVARRTGVTIAELARMWWRKQMVADVRVRARKFRESLVRLGPFYVKLGQALSTRPDILPPEYCAELALLQDRMAPFPCHVALATVQQELGVPPSQLFAEFSSAPVAAASLGQVYKARLLSGECVAVKVQRPAVRHQIALDSLVVRRVAALLQPLVHGRSDLVAIADQLVCRMFDEVDYQQEGLNAERFHALYGDHSDPQGNEQRKSSRGTRRGLVKVPRIFWKYSSRRVLTMEWIDGIKLTDRAGLLQAGLSTQFVVDLGVLSSLRQLLEEGFFHADPHPGNLVVTRGGQLAYFDFGMMGELPPQQRISIIRAVVHYVNRDAQGLAEDFRALHFVPPDAHTAPVAAALKDAFQEPGARRGEGGEAGGEESGGGTGSTSGMDFQGVILRLSSVMYRFRFSLPPHLSLVVRALGSLEGTATTLDPNFKVVATAYPFIIARLLSDPSPEMRAILRQMLLWPDGRIRWQRLQRLASVLSKPSSPHSNAAETGTRADEEEERALGREQSVGQQRDKRREGADEATSEAAAQRSQQRDEVREGVDVTNQKPRQRDDLREGVDEAAVVAAAGDFVAYVMSRDGSSTRGWLVRDAVSAGQRWVEVSLGSTQEVLEQRWAEEGMVRRRREERGGEGEVRREERGERGGEGRASSSSSSAIGSALDGVAGVAGTTAQQQDTKLSSKTHDTRSSNRKEEAPPQAPPVDPLGALGALVAAVQRAPELWVPLLVETAGRAEAREMAGSVVRGVAGAAADSAVEGALLAVSHWLHSK
ncbi:hypothetical protein CLOM_g873 [Closterium sp. NIES-68]|nr:hypothetical protein CLOM_g873 [Closterium sp. NIES-68]GJP65924.1 hypothetical protein CLOP_g22821 [Closterium sp. NIES-67]